MPIVNELNYSLFRAGEENVWAVSVDLPVDTDIPYRYFISANDAGSDEVHVRKWETHLKTRTVRAAPLGGGGKLSSYDTFGELDGQRKVDRGWLTTETIVQFVFFKNPFLFNERIRNKRVYAKVTPMNLRVSSEAQDITAFLEDSLSNDTHDTHGDPLPAFAFVDVCTLGSGAGEDADTTDQTKHSQFEPQGQFGKAYKPDDVLIVHIHVNEPENVAYLIDLYAKRLDAASDVPPVHLGYHYILPNVLRHSEGVLDVPVTCASKHRPLGMMRVEYLNVSEKKTKTNERSL